MDHFHLSLPLPFHLQVGYKTLENFGHPWDVRTSMFLLLCLLNVLQVLLRDKKLFKNTIERSVPRLDSCERQGVWGSVGKYLEQWAHPVF